MRGPTRRMSNADTLREYWSGHGHAGPSHGAERDAIAWGTPGDFSRCVALVSEHGHMTTEQAKGYCNLRHHEATGEWPAQHAKEERGKMSPVTSELAEAGAAYARMRAAIKAKKKPTDIYVEGEGDTDHDGDGLFDADGDGDGAVATRVEKDWTQWDQAHGGTGAPRSGRTSTRQDAASAVQEAHDTIVAERNRNRGGKGKKPTRAQLRNAHLVHEAHLAHERVLAARSRKKAGPHGYVHGWIKVGDDRAAGAHGHEVEGDLGEGRGVVVGRYDHSSKTVTDQRGHKHPVIAVDDREGGGFHHEVSTSMLPPDIRQAMGEYENAVSEGLRTEAPGSRYQKSGPRNPRDTSSGRFRTFQGEFDEARQALKEGRMNDVVELLGSARALAQNDRQRMLLGELQGAIARVQHVQPELTKTT